MNAAIIPDMIVFLGFIGILTAGFFRGLQFSTLQIISSVFLTTALAFHFALPHTPGPIFNNHLLFDSFGFAARALILFIGLFLILITQKAQIKNHPHEYFAFLMAIVSGALIMVVSNHFVILMIAIEVTAIASYILTGYLFQLEGTEAAVKYFIYGSVATAVLAFGISLIYGATGNLIIHDIAGIVREALSMRDTGLLTLGFLMITAALLFKLAAAPVHLWAPDVYQAAPTPVLAIFSTLPKIASAIVLVKLLISGDGRVGEPQTIACLLAALTLAAGNFPALRQTNVKRLMAYASIGQAGFLLTAMAATPDSAKTGLLFYALTMAIASLLVFYCLQFFEHNNEGNTIQGLAGLGKFNPLGALGLTAGLLSLIGLPPFAGFSAKLIVFMNLWTSGGAQGNKILLFLFIFGLLNSLLALFYYLQIPLNLLLRKSANDHIPKHLKISESLIILFLTILLLLLFIKPELGIF
jgi:NADH-quinone oxidoreductase subunit N